MTRSPRPQLTERIMTFDLFVVTLTSPPAAQAATNAYCPFSCSNLLAAVVTNLTPVAPNGCPIDNEPPHKLNLSIGGVPTYKRKSNICINWQYKLDGVYMIKVLFGPKNATQTENLNPSQDHFSQNTILIFDDINMTHKYNMEACLLTLVILYSLFPFAKYEHK